MSIFVKELEDGRIIEAPRNYKNISNFNKFPSLMKKEGFVERIKGWKKSDGALKYIEPEKWGQHKTFYTTYPYQGSEYEWNEEIGSWQMKLDVAKEMKLDEIHNSVNAYMEKMKKGFSNAEMETWARQENGVKLLIENPESEEYDAQWVKALAQTRGIPLEEMMQRIQVAVNTMNTLAYQIVGYQQHLEDLINKASTIDEVFEINFNI